MKEIIYILNPFRNIYRYELYFKNGEWRAICFALPENKLCENRKWHKMEIKKFFKQYGLKEFYVNKQLSFSQISSYIPAKAHERAV